jgi:ubiquinone/menaquinone biosynthesis C-methylase UbiE
VTVPYTVGQFALGLEGIALFRSGATASEEALETRVAELTALARVLGDPSLAAEATGPEVDLARGYAQWAAGYDDEANPLVAIEEPAVRVAIDTWEPHRRVLDAACGTGRHSAWLVQRGHHVMAIDQSPEMLAVARQKVPDVEFQEAELTALPFPDGEFDAAVCALALSHCPDLAGPVTELARVVRPGGRIVISDFHPFMILLGGQAAFRTGDGTPRFVRSYPHLLGVVLPLLDRVGLQVIDCAEPTWTFEAAAPAFPGMSPELFHEALAGLPLAVVWNLERDASVATVSSPRATP